MPRIPDKWLGKRIQAKLEDLNTNKMQLLTIAMALVVFVVSVFEITSFFLHDKVSNYDSYWYPLITSIELFMFSLFFVFKAFRYTSCLDTKSVSIMLSCVYFISIFSLVLKIKALYYIVVAQPLILIIVSLLTLTSIIRWLLK